MRPKRSMPMYDPIADFARVLEALDETEIRKRTPVFADDYRCTWYPPKWAACGD
jgi:hypothetical protein